MGFRRDQRVTSTAAYADSQVYRVESGPHRGVSGSALYLVERIGGAHAGTFVLRDESSIRPQPPVKGDRGRIANSVYSPHRIYSIDEEYVFTIDKDGDPGGYRREDFDRNWQPLP